MELRHKDEQREQLMRELQQTNALLRDVINLYHPGASVGAYNTMANGIPPTEQAAHLTQPGRMRGQGFGNGLPLESTSLDSSMYLDESGAIMDTSMEPEIDPMAEAYARLMSDPTQVADTLAAKLNEALKARRQEGRHHHAAATSEAGAGGMPMLDDSVVEQVLDSDAISQLIDQILPPLPEGEENPPEAYPGWEQTASQGAAYPPMGMMVATAGGYGLTSSPHSNGMPYSQNPAPSQVLAPNGPPAPASQPSHSSQSKKQKHAKTASSSAHHQHHAHAMAPIDQLPSNGYGAPMEEPVQPTTQPAYYQPATPAPLAEYEPVSPSPAAKATRKLAITTKMGPGPIGKSGTTSGHSSTVTSPNPRTPQTPSQPGPPPLSHNKRSYSQIDNSGPSTSPSSGSKQKSTSPTNKKRKLQ